MNCTSYLYSDIFFYFFNIFLSFFYHKFFSHLFFYHRYFSLLFFSFYHNFFSGFDRAIPRMSIGERSKLTFTPEYACTYSAWHPVHTIILPYKNDIFSNNILPLFPFSVNFHAKEGYFLSDSENKYITSHSTGTYYIRITFFFWILAPRHFNRLIAKYFLSIFFFNFLFHLLLFIFLQLSIFLYNFIFDSCQFVIILFFRFIVFRR